MGVKRLYVKAKLEHTIVLGRRAPLPARHCLGFDVPQFCPLIRTSSTALLSLPQSASPGCMNLKRFAGWHSFVQRGSVDAQYGSVPEDACRRLHFG